MSFAKELLKLQASQTAVCKVGVILKKLPPKDSEVLASVLNSPENSPKRLSNTQIAKFLKSENYSISTSTVDRHRRGDCSCEQQEIDVIVYRKARKTSLAR